MKGRQLAKRLRALGVAFDAKRGKGGHMLAKYEGRQTTVPMHGDRDLSPEFIKMLCKQLGIDPQDVL